MILFFFRRQDCPGKNYVIDEREREKEKEDKRKYFLSANMKKVTFFF